MNDVMCMNHPEWPADETGADYGPPLCTACARSTGLPAPDVDDSDAGTSSTASAA